MFHMTPEELVKLKSLHEQLAMGQEPSAEDRANAIAPAPEVDIPQMSPTAASDPYNKRADENLAIAKQLEDKSLQPAPKPQGTKQVLISAARTALENFGRYGAPGGSYGQDQLREKQFETQNARLADRAKELRGDAEKQQQLGIAAETGARTENYQQGELADRREANRIAGERNATAAKHEANIESWQRDPNNPANMKTEFGPAGSQPFVNGKPSGSPIPKETTPKQLESKTVMVNGKPEVWAVDMNNPAGAKLVNKIGDAPPQSGANSALQVEQGKDESGRPAFFVVNKSSATSTPVKTGNGQTLASKPTSQEVNRADQADTVSAYADHILALIDANPNAVGPIAGRIAKGETVLGNIDPGAKTLGTALGSFEALQPILHGFRGGSQTVDHFKNVIGDQHLNAASLKASIAEIKLLSKYIKTGMLPPMDEATGGETAASGSKHVNWNDLP